MNDTEPQLVAGLEISHGAGRGHAITTDGTVSAFADRRSGPEEGRPVILFVRDGPHVSLMDLSEEALRCLRAAIIASGCQHHGQEAAL